MDELTFELFEPHVGTVFKMVSNGQPPLEVTLAQVNDLTMPGRWRDPNIRERPFSLIFHGPLSPVIPQQIVQLDHAVLGSVEMFVVPNGPDQQSRHKMCYQAIFN